MGEKPIDWGLLIDLPYTYALIIRTTGHSLVISGNNNIPDPFFMSMICSGVKPSADFPKLDSLVSRAGNQIIPIKKEINKTDIMIMSMECLTTNIIVIKIPKLNA
jgi:hypothetical protein